MSPDRTYRLVVLPLAGHVTLCGVVFLILFFGFEPHVASPLPFIESQAGNRTAFKLVSLFLIVTGFGLFRRSAVAWKMLLIYMSLSRLSNHWHLRSALLPVVGRKRDPIRESAQCVLERLDVFRRAAGV